MATFEKRKTSKGETRWRAVVRRQGVIMRKTFATKSDAQDWARQTETAVAMNDPHIRRRHSAKHTLNDLIDYYKSAVMPARPKAKVYREHQLDWWASKLGQLQLHRIEPKMIADYRDELAHSTNKLGKKFAPATVNRYVSGLSHVFTVGVKMQWLDKNPAMAVDNLPEPDGRTRFLSPEEKDRLLAECQLSRNRHLYPVVLLALSTGMRKNEIQRLTWADVDFARGRIVLLETKNKDVRVVPLVGVAAEQLHRHKEVGHGGERLLFPQKKNPEKNVDVREAFENAVKRAEIDDFVFHDLRHTAASYLLMNGASLAEIASILGHRTLQMVQRYAHLSEAHTASVVERMNRAFLG